ncbi:hypothetical protein HAX54_034648 [Datura stramonium]|uniref:Uncharacterized protein n=1 Tax=Datura stramonium TaxID=4076 RepID=A0ABS8SEH2_DATST|nr:hypothetical protein [Datura stramonium]
MARTGYDPTRLAIDTRENLDGGVRRALLLGGYCQQIAPGTEGDYRREGKFANLLATCLFFHSHPYVFWSLQLTLSVTGLWQLVFPTYYGEYLNLGWILIKGLEETHGTKANYGNKQVSKLDSQI